MNKKWLSFFLSIVMIISMVAPALAQDTTPLVIGSGAFSEKFSPFFYDTVYDRHVVELTQVKLLTTDRTGAIVFNAIEGETRPYNGVDYFYNGVADTAVDYDEASDTTKYTVKLRDDLYFSDGVQATADDIIFTYYVFLDPAYVGSTTLRTYPIIGLQDYLTQTTSDVYAKYETLANGIIEAGRDHEWTDADAWTQEQQDAYWALIDGRWTFEVQGIVDYVNAKYADKAAEALGVSADEIAAEPGLKIAAGMTLWGFGDVADGVLTAKSGKTFKLADGEFPTIEDYVAETVEAYAGDANEFFSTESTNSDNQSILSYAKDTFISDLGSQDPEMGEGIPNISGIRKVDDYTVEITTDGYEAPTIYQLFEGYLAPMHYYGDPEQYDYDNNMFGHPYNDLSIVEAKTNHPMGAGPYKFIRYENKVVYFEASEHYFDGEPVTKEVQYRETNTNEFVAALSAGTIDVGDMSGSKSNYEEIASYNSNGDINGDVVNTIKVDNLGYGYIGMNADTMNVGGEPGSEASKNLRRGIATVFSVYRDTAYDSYYGEAASVINYPISNTSWAAPQKTDPDYKVAFSVDVDGNDIYTDDMDAEAKYAAALDAAVGFFKAAGYTFDEATGKFTAAPEGAKMSYEVIIGGDGTGDHPSFAVLTDAQAALAKIGIDIRINDPADGSVMWDALDAGKQEMWCAAWQSTIDPDMYQVYHSSGIVGRGGSDSNHYHIADPALDEAIVLARQSDDQAYRKQVYKTALDIIVDWAVEIPAYQRQNATIYSSQRIVPESMLPDSTTFLMWDEAIDRIEMATK
ncbi:hypothetical protein BEQ56_08240 [Anaerolineaceae bacterium oral taxon 439]|nr:hypothetical protein BEQ56_08240 [Anaerolineaceae bacterium oral taxon 439]